MPFLQELIHKVEVGGGMRFVKIGLVTLVVLGVTGFYDFRSFRNMSTQEAMDAAQLGRNVAQGKGFTTLFVRPFSIYLVKKHNRQNQSPADPSKPADPSRIKGRHPDLANPPLYPLVLAALMKVLPFQYAVPASPKVFWSLDGKFWRYQPDFLISAFNQLLFFALIVLVFFLVRRLFDSRTAWLSAALLFGTELMWRFSMSGLSTMLLLLIFVALVWCLVLLEQGARELAWTQGRLVMLAVLAGALVGLGGLTRYAFAWLVFPVLLYLVLFGGSRRLVFASVAFIAFLVVMTPWVIRNHHLSGAPFGTATYTVLQNTPLFPENRLERSLEPDVGPHAWKLFFLRVLPQKLISNSRQIIQGDLPKLGGGWISAFFLVGLLIGSPTLTVGRLRYFLLMCIAVLGVAQALGRTQLSEDSLEINSENLLVLLTPLVLAYGVSFAFLLLDQLELPLRELRYLVLALFGAVACLPMIFALLPPKPIPVAYPPYYPPAIQDAVGWTRENELAMSDIPWAVAWYGQTQCVWLTLNAQSDFLAINDYLKPIQEIYLTRVTLDSRFVAQWVMGGEQTWGSLILQSLPRIGEDAARWPKQVNLRLRQTVGDPITFPLRYWQRGWPEGFLLTAREHWPKPQ
jgi:4-amino-4-deoxy-L-arabinose transferase-like glycosyltransferase